MRRRWKRESELEWNNGRNGNLKRILDQICRDKGIDRSLLIECHRGGGRAAVRKKYGSRREIEVQFNDDLGEVEVFQYRTVVDEVYDEETEISFVDARVLDPDAELDDDLGEKLDNIADLGRIAAQSAKQVIIHRMRDAERDVIYEMYRDREGSIVNGIVQRFERGDMIINLGRTDAVLPRDEPDPQALLQTGRPDSRLPAGSPPRGPRGTLPRRPADPEPDLQRVSRQAL